MTYLQLCFLCIGILAIIAVLRLMKIVTFRIEPLALVIGIAAFICFYLAQSNGEIHNLSQRIAVVIVRIVQMFVR